jgi:hypothetical protein
MKFIDKQDRSILGEGRSYQMGFAFVKPTVEKRTKVFTTVQPITACKDYLNDVVWAEHTNKQIKAYGLGYKKQGIFDKEKGYIVISILPYQGGGEYPNMQKDIKNLKENYKTLQKFINFFDENIGLNPTKIVEIKDNKYLVELDYKWCQTTYAISLMTLLLRVGQFYKKGDPLKFLKTFGAFPPDTYMAIGVVPKLEKFINVKSLPDQNLEDFPGNTITHNAGIMSYVLK